MIILLGFPKSGTTSFHELFKTLGYNSYHWKKKYIPIGLLIKNNKLNNLPLLNDFNKDDCITQMDICISNELSYWPQITDYEQIYNENPDSIFILNKRDPSKILASFKKWNNPIFLTRLYMYSSELIQDKTDEGFINFVINHYNNIENFFKSKPQNKFIIYDIENDNINKLSKYIDIKDIKEFPHENHNLAT